MISWYELNYVLFSNYPLLHCADLTLGFLNEIVEILLQVVVIVVQHWYFTSELTYFAFDVLLL